MWCKTCNIETNEDYCPICNTKTIEDIPAKIYWCPDCRIPIIQDETQANKGICPVCNTKIKYMSADLRPVFPEERLLIEILLEKKPNQFIKSSVWASNSRYYIDGKSFILPSKLFNKINLRLSASSVLSAFFYMILEFKGIYFFIFYSLYPKWYLQYYDGHFYYNNKLQELYYLPA